MGTQKNCLNETVLLSNQNTCLNRWIRKQSQFYAHKFCLTGPMKRRHWLVKNLSEKVSFFSSDSKNLLWCSIEVSHGDHHHLYPPQTLFVGGILFSCCPCVRPSVTLCFLNNSKSHCWIFIKPCKHVHICKTNTLDKKVRARGQFY